jgi:hypothetical protein
MHVKLARKPAKRGLRMLSFVLKGLLKAGFNLKVV